MKHHTKPQSGSEIVGEDTLDKLFLALRPEPPKPPPGSRSVKQLAALWGLGDKAARARVDKLVKQGKLRVAASIPQLGGQCAYYTLA